MKKLLTPLVHNQMKDIAQVEQLSPEDMECIGELKTILLKYNKQERFGINLLHKHFDLKEDEIMVERIDELNRILTTGPVKINEVKNALVQTVWCFSTNSELEKSCESYCPNDANGNHFGYRDHL